MSTLANFFRHYLPVRLGGGPGAVIAGVNRATPVQSFQPVGLQDFLDLQVPPREMLLAPICPNEAWRCFMPQGALANLGLA
jgi:hypothetical protein